MCLYLCVQFLMLVCACGALVFVCEGSVFAHRCLCWCFTSSLTFYSFSWIQHEQTVIPVLYPFYILCYGYCLSSCAVLIFFSLLYISFPLFGLSLSLHLFLSFSLSLRPLSLPPLSSRLTFFFLSLFNPMSSMAARFSNSLKAHCW